MILMIPMQKDKIGKCRFEENWNKLVFMSSIIGLVLLITISLIRYYVIIPKQLKVCDDYQYIKSLQNENLHLKEEIDKMKKSNNHEDK